MNVSLFVGRRHISITKRLEKVGLGVFWMAHTILERGGVRESWCKQPVLVQLQDVDEYQTVVYANSPSASHIDWPYAILLVPKDGPIPERWWRHYHDVVPEGNISAVKKAVERFYALLDQVPRAEPTAA